MNRLKGQRCYLGGSMDFLSDGGLGWRKEITPILQDFGLTVLNPGNKPTKKGQEDNPEYWAYKRKLKEEYRFDELSAIMNEVSKIDLRMVDISDFLIVNLDMTHQPCGTFHEIYSANLQKKPILIIAPGDIRKIPDWLFGRLKWQNFFANKEDMLVYLHHINSAPIDKIDTLGRWQFFNL